MAESSGISHDFPCKLQKLNYTVTFQTHFVKTVAPSQLKCEKNQSYDIMITYVLI